jgi:hypothetical protein
MISGPPDTSLIPAFCFCPYHPYHQAYVVLGTALTGASAAFVLTTGQPTPARQQAAAAAAGGAGPLQLPQGPGEQPLQLGTMSQLRLWNPLSGHCCPVKDPAGELREVGGWVLGGGGGGGGRWHQRRVCVCVEGGVNAYAMTLLVVAWVGGLSAHGSTQVSNHLCACIQHMV